MSTQQAPVKTGLLDFFRTSTGNQFVIPVYQRNYTWTANKEVNQYLEDLENVVNGTYDKHFLGIMIYLDTPINYKSREFSVIDGQQRLTTTFLILYAIKNLMIEKGMEEDANALDAQFLTNQFVDDKLKFKLKPLVADDNVYQQIVNNQLDEITEKNSNIYKNYIWIRKELEKMLLKYSFDNILMGMNKLYIVCIPVSKEDHPQKIFESINSTGAKLVASDLIRNYILMDIQSDIQEKYYINYWNKLEKYISNDSKKLELFFRMYLACKNKTLSNVTAIYREFKELYKKELEHSDVESILKEIVMYAKYYNNIYIKPLAELDVNLRNSIHEYRKILSDMPAPFLMEMYRLYEEVDSSGKRLISEKQFNEIIELVNTYLIRRAICGLDTSDITRIFPTVLKDVLNEYDGNYEYIVEYTKKNLVNKQRGKAAAMPDDEYLHTYLKTANVYSNRLTLRAIFDRIETKGNPAPVDLSKLSVEHLMPQTPTKEWLQDLNVDEITYEKYLHRIGNLTLATKVDNSKMKNKPWEYKKSILEDTSHLVMNKKILEVEKWGIEEIEKRTDFLIDKISELYPYFSASDEVIKKHDIYLNWDGVKATAYLYEEDGSVEVLAGSEIVKYETQEYCEDWQYDIYNDLLEEGVIKETVNGATFVKDYLFTSKSKNRTSLSLTAGVILCGSRNGWEYWTDSNNNRLNDDLELKKRLTNR